jgi:hypothetical protein
MFAILWLVSAAAAAPINNTAPINNNTFPIPLPPGVNACLVVDPAHEVVIGPPPRLVKTEGNNNNNNLWLIFAYALEIVVVAALASLLRIGLMKRARRSASDSGESPPTIPMIRLMGSSSSRRDPSSTAI